MDNNAYPNEEWIKENKNSSDNKKDKKKWVVGIVLALALVALGVWAFKKGQEGRKGKPIDVENGSKQSAKEYPLANQGNVSPISGLACENWNRRPMAFMQPADVPARPAAGFSQADMVVEIPVITASITRLMGVYICELPKEVGSMRSARHDFIHIAKGLDAIFIPWGRSESHSDSDPIGLAQGILNRNEIDNINCNGDAGVSPNKCSVSPCFRKEGMSRGVDSGYASPIDAFKCAEELGYRLTSNFSGYPHQGEAPVEERPQGGKLRVAFAGPFAVEYQYDKEKNAYLREWGGEPDTDRNNDKRLAPKNVAVLIARSDQIEGQYNNVQLGDPWYDKSDSGEAFFYMNGKEIKGRWKKDKAKIDSKLLMQDEAGGDIKFVPGQIWVEILEPGQGLKWTPMTS